MRPNPRQAIVAMLIALSAVSAWAATEDGEGEKIDASYLSLRDIFKAPDIIIEGKDELKSDLELYPVADFKMVGVMTGPEKVKGMVLLPNSRTYFVNEGDRVGIRGGEVTKITPDTITVHEKIVNVLGQEEDVLTDIKLLPELVPE